MKLLSRDKVIKLLQSRQNGRTRKELAEELEMTPQQLSRVFLGKEDPGPRLLGKLGLKRVSYYEDISRSS